MNARIKPTAREPKGVNGKVGKTSKVLISTEAKKPETFKAKLERLTGKHIRGELRSKDLRDSFGDKLTPEQMSKLLALIRTEEQRLLQEKLAREAQAERIRKRKLAAARRSKQVNDGGEQEKIDAITQKTKPTLILRDPNKPLPVIVNEYLKQIDFSNMEFRDQLIYASEIVMSQKPVIDKLSSLKDQGAIDFAKILIMNAIRKFFKLSPIKLS